jgi:hypothetical protein
MFRTAGIAVAMVLVAAASASPASFKSVWKNPQANNLSLAGKKIVALVVSDDMGLRQSAEEALASDLTARGANGIAAYRVIPSEELRDKAKARIWFERAGADAVVLMRLVSSKQAVVYSPTFWTTSYYGSLWDYYGYAWTAVGPGDLSLERVLTVQTLIYGVQSGQLIWASASEKTNPRNIRRLVESLVKDIAKEMRKQGLVPAGTK